MSRRDTRQRAFEGVRRPTTHLAVCALLLLGACHADPGYGGRSSAEWIAQLSAPDHAQRVDAAQALGRVLAIQPNAPSVVAALVVALADTNDDVRVTAADGLRNAARGGARVQATLARDAVPGIIALLADSQHVSVRRDAARILGALGATAEMRAVDPLGRALHDPSPEVRREAAGALTGQHGLAPAAVPRLLEASRDTDLDVRRIALAALASSSAPASIVGPALVQGLSDSAAAIREAVARGLGQRGPSSVRALAVSTQSSMAPILALRHATRDPAWPVRLAAVMSLGLIDDATGRPEIERALADPDSAVRREAAHALTALHRRGGRDASLPEPSLLELCRSNPRWPGCGE